MTSPTGRQGGMPQVIAALQQLQNDEDRLAQERRQRYESPPPYSETGETTDSLGGSPPTYDAEVSEDYINERFEEFERQFYGAKSTPYVQFRAQADRESDRLAGDDYWLQTLGYDYSLDLRANAENNVRNRWIKQGIWADVWGPAWPKGSKACVMLGRGDGPFSHTYRKNMTDACINVWGHHIVANPEPAQAPAQRPNIWPTTQSPSATIIRPVKTPKVLDPEASRPCHQFNFQVAREREWLTPEGSVDLDALAYEIVKNNWKEDGIWDETWGETPGHLWSHERTVSEELTMQTALRLGDTDIQTQEGRHFVFGRTTTTAAADSQPRHERRGGGGYGDRERTTAAEGNAEDVEEMTGDTILPEENNNNTISLLRRSTRVSNQTRTQVGAQGDPNGRITEAGEQSDINTKTDERGPVRNQGRVKRTAADEPARKKSVASNKETARKDKGVNLRGGNEATAEINGLRRSARIAAAERRKRLEATTVEEAPQTGSRKRQRRK